MPEEKAMPARAQIKSRERVAKHGEVFTAEREVRAMLDLVKGETERVDSRFLEPACGNGNFLVEILRRKLAVVRRRYARSRADYELNALIAVCSIYGVDILRDNVEECRERLFRIFKDEYTGLFPPSADYLSSIRYALSRNVIWGDALTMKTPEKNAAPIVFAEWSAVGTMIKRRDYTLSQLLYQPMTGANLFSDLGEEAFIQPPAREYPLTHYLKLSDYEE